MTRRKKRTSRIRSFSLAMCKARLFYEIWRQSAKPAARATDGLSELEKLAPCAPSWRIAPSGLSVRILA